MREGKLLSKYTEDIAQAFAKFAALSVILQPHFMPIRMVVIQVS